MNVSDIIEYFPYLIRAAALIIIVAAVCDYFSRKAVKSIIAAVNAAGAQSPDTAVTAAELDKIAPGSARLCRHFLKYGSSLRRVILCVPAEKCMTEVGKKTRKQPTENLTGNERWYIPAPVEDDVIGEGKTASVQRIPAVLREGGETTPRRLLVGVLLTVVFSEIIIHFLPQIVSLFESAGNIFGE